MRLQIGILLTALAACATSGEPRGELELFKVEDPAMGTLFRASFYAADAEEAASAWEAAIARVREIERAASDWDSESELRQLSARSVGEWSQLSDDLAVLLAEELDEDHLVDGAISHLAQGGAHGRPPRPWRRTARCGCRPRP